MQTAESQTFAPTGVGFLRKPFHSRGHRDEGMSRAQGWRFGLRRGDRLLAGNEEPPLGAHLVTARFAYAHHGVYVGLGAVVHYAAFAKLWRRGPVEEISLTRFADRHPVWVRPARPTGLPGAEIVRRARSRLGEDRYRFLSNNCEHLSEWCVNGEHRSSQVERFLRPLHRLSGVLNDLRRLLRATPFQRSGA
jgi:Lecithin retinol acyltransferase